MKGEESERIQTITEEEFLYQLDSNDIRQDIPKEWESGSTIHDDPPPVISGLCTLPPPMNRRTRRAIERVRRLTPSTILAAEEFQKNNEARNVPASYRKWRRVFEKKNFDTFPPVRPWDHEIELKPDATPYSATKAYHLSRDEQVALDDFLEENLRTGRIRPSKSEWASPFFFVKKKDGGLRPVQDYRQLNA